MGGGLYSGGKRNESVIAKFTMEIHIILGKGGGVLDRFTFIERGTFTPLFDVCHCYSLGSRVVKKKKFKK